MGRLLAHLLGLRADRSDVLGQFGRLAGQLSLLGLEPGHLAVYDLLGGLRALRKEFLGPLTDVLLLAMKREEKALQLYNELAGKADNDDFIKLFKLLAQEEAKHKRALEIVYDDFMAEQGD